MLHTWTNMLHVCYISIKTSYAEKMKNFQQGKNFKPKKVVANCIFQEGELKCILAT